MFDPFMLDPVLGFFFIPFLVGAFVGASAFSLGVGLVAAVGIGIVGFALTQLLAGGTAQQDPPRPDEFDTATTTEARPVPIVFGTVRMPGNFLRIDKSTFRTERLSEKVKTGLFSSKRVTTGYNYYVSFDYGICAGPIDRVSQVTANPGEDILWKGNLRTDTPVGVQATVDQVFYTGGKLYYRIKGGMPFRVGQEVVVTGNAKAEYNQTFVIEEIPENIFFSFFRKDSNFDSRNTVVVSYTPPQDPNENPFNLGNRFNAQLQPEEEKIIYYDGGFMAATYVNDQVGLINLKGKEKGGSCILYWGKADQNRDYADVYGGAAVGMHRGVCYAHCRDYFMGSGSRPPSLLFEIGRLPVALSASGAQYSETQFPARGSGNPNHPAYEEANPATCIYELLTNKLWGRGLDVGKIDVEAFQSAAKHYRDNDVGVSFTLGTQRALSDAIDSMRSHVELLVFAKNDVLTCRALTDRTTAYNNPITLTRDMLSEIQMQRPAWAGTTNELRATFINRLKNYGQEMVSAQDPASVTMAGAINSRQVNLKAFSNRRTAEKQVNRILTESAYPAATLTAKMNRFVADMDPGSFIEFVIDDFAGGQPTTSYWRVQDITDSEQDSAGLEISLKEDYYATPFVGYPGGSFIPPVPSYEIRETIDDDDINLGDDFSTLTDPGEITSFDIINIPSSITNKVSVALMALSAESADLYNTDCEWRPAGDLWQDLYLEELPEAYPMTLDADLDKVSIRLQRNQAVAFTVANEWQRAKIVEYSDFVKTDLDHFAYLSQQSSSCLFLNEEIIQIGYSTETATGVEIVNFERGAFGTEIQDHPLGSTGYFFQSFQNNTNLLEVSGLPLNQTLEFRFQRYTFRDIWGESAFISSSVIDNTYQRPMIMTEAETIKTGSTWALKIRPRTFSSAQLVETYLQTIFDYRTTINVMGVRVVVRDGAAIISNQNLSINYFTGASPGTGVQDYTFNPQNDTDPKSGTLEINVLGVTGNRVIDIYTIDPTNGLESKQALTII